MESVYDTGKKKICPDLQCPMKFKSNDTEIRFLSGAWLVLSSFGFDCKQNQILSKLTLIFCSTECKTYRKSPGKIYSHQISSKSLQFHRNGTCSKKTCRIRSEGEKWSFWVPGVPAAPLGFSDETRIYFWCMSQLKTWRNIIFLCDDLS